MWRLPRALYIEHLAVIEAQRGNGVGGYIVDKVVEMAAGLPVVVEVELPDANDMAPRRIRFYENHGFEPLSDFPYFQPPYQPGFTDVELMLMVNGQLDDVKAFVVMLHTLVYNQ